MRENFPGPVKSGPIKWLTRLSSDPIKRSRLDIYNGHNKWQVAQGDTGASRDALERVNL